MILALDPGQRTGWARSDGRCGTLDFTNMLWGEASQLFSAWLTDQLDEGVARVVYEQPFVRTADTALALGIVWDTIRLAHMRGLPVPKSVTPTQKYKALGLRISGLTRTERGRLLRDAVAATKRWQPVTQHEVDAAALLMVIEATGNAHA